ncbi:MAG: hypothetical protein O7C75_04005 [Verrucomicrobia bacterium]|nr:hypothetical protein [Verrucomicrobiota bacterium]
MARRIANLVLLLGLISCASWQAWAQDPAETRRSISFWAYRVGNGNWSDIRFEASTGEVDTLSLGKFMKGRIHEYQGPAQLLFFREQPDPTPEDPDRMVRIPIAQTQIPSGVKEAILIFTPVPKNSTAEFSVYFVDADPSYFPSNSLRVFNATGVRLAGKVGKENRYFNPGISTPFSLTSFLEEGIPVAFMVETKEGPKFVFEKDLEYAANRRIILLLEPPRRKGSYKIQATNLIEVIEEKDEG